MNEWMMLEAESGATNCAAAPRLLRERPVFSWTPAALDA
jgi:hypothetical protein